MPAIPYNSGIDLQNVGEVQNAKFQMLASAPNPLEARFYYDTTLKMFGYHNGTQWIYCTTPPVVNNATITIQKNGNL